MAFDLPEWMNEELKFNAGKELQQGHVAEAMFHGERPYYSLSQMERALDYDFSRDTIRDRLNEMTEIGVLRKEPIQPGEIWWINHPETDWPKPTDAEIAPLPDEPTVSEFLSRPHNFLATVCVLAAAGSGLILWVGTLQSSGRLSLPFETSQILALGLSVILLSYMGILLAAYLWIIRRGVGELPEGYSLRDLLKRSK